MVAGGLRCCVMNTAHVRCVKRVRTIPTAHITQTFVH
jgi:hypothetical protein